MENSLISMRFFGGFCFLFFLCFLLFFLDLAFGSVSIPLDTTMNWIFNEEVGIYTKILELYRLPKAMTAALAGACLSLCGLLMQTWFQNPLADPYVLGISSGASLGVAICILFAGQWFGASFGAMVGSFLVLFLILLVARRTSPATLLIFGLMFGYISSGIISLLVWFTDEKSIREFMMWSYGSFSRLDQEGAFFYAALVIPILLVTFLFSKPLNLLHLGEDYARSLGVGVERLRLFILCVIGILSAITTAFCGPVAFLGIATPHFARFLFKTWNHQILIPATILTGINLALFADLFSKFPGLEETIPLNSVLSLIGAPVVIFILFSGKEL